MQFILLGIINTAIAAFTRPTSVTFQGQTVNSAQLKNHRGYLGIPYAKAPVGTLRFANPVAAPALTGPRDFKTFGYSCYQFTTDKSRIGTPESEDCLTINVYVPNATPTAINPPVIVWIHGGAFVSGSSSNPRESLDYFALDFVKVSFNYRLGAFGFLPGNDTTSFRNAGLLDQKMALEWVKANIGTFGGNPNSITVIGQDAGATSIAAHMIANKGTQTMFNKTILLSPGLLNLPFYSSTENTARSKILTAAGCTTIACLQTTPTAAGIIAASSGVTFYPGVDYPTYIMGPPSASIQYILISKVPTLIHFNANEGSTFGLVNSDADAKALRRAQAPFFTSAMHTNLDAKYPYTGPQNGGDFYADLLLYCPGTTLLQLFTTAGVPIYASYNPYSNVIRPYGNTVASSVNIGAAHGAELPHLFQTQSEIASNETAYSQRVQKTFLDFALSPLSFTPYGTSRFMYSIWSSALIYDGRRDTQCTLINQYLNTLVSTQFFG